MLDATRFASGLNADWTTMCSGHGVMLCSDSSSCSGFAVDDQNFLSLANLLLKIWLSLK